MNKTDLLQPLVVTPKPFHGESYMGFVLRTAEDNAYPSINSMLRYAGLTENEIRSARPPLSKLAKLYGRKAEDFASLEIKETGSVRYMSLQGHELPSIYLRSKHARVCPDCVREHGHISAFWELRHAVACPTHGRMALSHCPDCGREIDWWRMGLTTCSCGYDFSENRGAKVEELKLLAFLDYMKAKLMGTEVDEAVLAYFGFPVAEMKGLSLSTLLGIINRLENYLPAAANDSDVSKDWEGVEVAVRVLSDWPNGLHKYLESVHGPQADMRAKGLRGQFESFYEAFFKKGLPQQEIEFLHKAFVDFGKQHWKLAAIHPRLDPERTSNIVGIYGLAEAMGVHPSTARKLVAKGEIPVHAHNPLNGRMLFDLSGQLPFEFAKGKSLSLDAAAEILDIPAKVLKAYRARGHYHARYLASPAVLYHERDVEALKSDLMKDCQLIKSDNELRQITMRKVMLKKLGASEIKAAFMAAVRSREIKPVGRFGDKPGDLVFDAKEVKDFLNELHAKLAGTVSLEEAQETLQLDQDGIYTLLREGMLKCSYSDLGVRILKDPLLTFLVHAHPKAA